MILTSLGQLDKSKRYTYADYLLWDFPERVELILGKVFPMSPAPMLGHQKMLLKLGKQFLDHFEGFPCEVYLAPVDVVLPGPTGEEDTVLQPDLIVVCDHNKLTEKNCKGAPDLVLEIISRSTARRDRNEKFRLYERYGVKEYWIVDGYSRSVEVFVRDPEGVFRLDHWAPQGEKACSRYFPGLEADTGEIFSWIAQEPQRLYGWARKKDERMRNRRMVRIR